MDLELMQIPREASKMSWHQVIDRFIGGEHSRSTLYGIHLEGDGTLEL